MPAARPPKSFLLSPELDDSLVAHGSPPDAVQLRLIEEPAGPIILAPLNMDEFKAMAFIKSSLPTMSTRKA
jgi:hypothetical protein